MIKGFVSMRIIDKIIEGSHLFLSMNLFNAKIEK